MIGAVAGDVIGSVFERQPLKTVAFPLFQKHSRFTDDSVLTIAIADAILNRRDYADSLRLFGRKYPDAGYGGAFRQWLNEPAGKPYNSWGNGSAMRVSPIGHAFATAEKVLAEAERSAAVTHNHSEGIKGAQATALAVFLARKGKGKKRIREEIGKRFTYNLERTLAEIRPGYRFDVSCQGSVPQAITAFLESTDYEGAIRNAISLGGDSDTLACIAGGIAQAFYRKVPENIIVETRKRLPLEFLQIIDTFTREYIHG